MNFHCISWNSFQTKAEGNVWRWCIKQHTLLVPTVTGWLNQYTFMFSLAVGLKWHRKVTCANRLQHFWKQMQIITKNKKFTMALTLLMKQVLKGMNWKKLLHACHCSNHLMCHHVCKIRYCNLQNKFSDIPCCLTSLPPSCWWSCHLCYCDFPHKGTGSVTFLMCRWQEMCSVCLNFDRQFSHNFLDTISGWPFQTKHTLLQLFKSFLQAVIFICVEVLQTPVFCDKCRHLHLVIFK